MALHWWLYTGEQWELDCHDGQMAAENESEGKHMEVYCGHNWKLCGFPVLSASGSQGHEVTVFACDHHSDPSLSHVTPSLGFTEVSSQIATGEQRSAGEVLMFHLPRGE